VSTPLASGAYRSSMDVLSATLKARPGSAPIAAINPRPYSPESGKSGTIPCTAATGKMIAARFLQVLPTLARALAHGRRNRLRGG
jgi:hypothetical protein